MVCLSYGKNDIKLVGFKEQKKYFVVKNKASEINSPHVCVPIVSFFLLLGEYAPRL
jgi:hypothetical protein